MVTGNYFYLTPLGEKNIKKYEYKGEDGSFLSKLLMPYWDFLTDITPQWLAPNLITFSSLVLVCVGFALHTYYMFNLEGDPPSWLHYFLAFMFFLYSTLDAVDGKHARKTCSYSALGEFFDHGGDALIAVLELTILCGLLNMGNTYWSFFTALLTSSSCVMCIWENYITDTLRFGEFNGPTEILMLATFICLFDAYFGCGFWKTNITELFSLSHILPAIELNHLAVLYGIFMGGSVIITNTIYVMRAANSEYGRKKGGVRLAILAIYPHVLNVVTFVTWSMVHSHLVYNHCFLFILAFSLTTSYIQIRMIFARISGERVNNYYFVIIPLPMIFIYAISSYFSPSIHLILPATMVLKLFLGFVVITYAHFYVCVLFELRKSLGIPFFSMPPKNLRHSSK